MCVFKPFVLKGSARFSLWLFSSVLCHTQLTSLSLPVYFLQLKPTLSQLHADLKTFEYHFDWLHRVSRKHQHAAIPKLVEIIAQIKNLINSLQRQVRLFPKISPRNSHELFFSD